MQALYAPVAAANAGYPDAIEPQVFVVSLIHDLGTNLFLSLANASPGLDAGDLRPKGGAGDPERGRHLATALVLYDGWASGGATGSDAERPRLATELLSYCLIVFITVSHLPFVER